MNKIQNCPTGRKRSKNCPTGRKLALFSANCPTGHNRVYILLFKKRFLENTLRYLQAHRFSTLNEVFWPSDYYYRKRQQIEKL